MIGVSKMKKILLMMCFAVIAAIGTQVGNMGAAHAQDVYFTDFDDCRMFVETESISYLKGGELHATYKLVSKKGSLITERSIRARNDEGSWWYYYVGSDRTFDAHQHPGDCQVKCVN